MCWKKFFEKFQEGCLLHDHLWYLSGMKEEFQSLFYLTYPMKFLPMRHMVRRKMLFYEFQDVY